MLKILAILALCYFFFRSVGHIVRLIFGKSTTTRTQTPFGNQQRKKTTREGLHVDSMPNQEKKRADFKGGDYVEYEELE